MKKIILFTCMMLSVGIVFAQEEMTIEELKAKKAEVQARFDAASGEASTAKAELDALEKELSIRAGWVTGITGLVGFNVAGSDQWIANPNPTSSSTALNIGLTGFANREQAKYFWNNKLIVNKAWQKVDVNGTNESALFDNGTVDILNLASLGGYKLSDQLALSGLIDFNSSIGNFLQPGTLDAGVGATWLPTNNLTVVVHPLNYRVTWSSFEDVASQGALGAKIRADYQNEFLVGGRKIAWSSTLTSFLPYGDTVTTIDATDEFGELTGMTREAGLFEWTWLNTFSFQVWKGIGVGVNFGLRNAEYEYQDLQSFYGLGLTYTL